MRSSLKVSNKSFLDSNQLKDMNKLAQLKFDNYIKANQKSVIALSEKMDTNLEPINIMGIFLWQVHSDIRNANSSMESYYESGNKDWLETAQTRAKKIERFLDSALFHELTLILKDAEDVYTKLTK